MGKMQEYEVLAIAIIPYNISIKHEHVLTPEFYLPSEVFLNQIEGKTPMLTTINMKDKHVESMEGFLTRYCDEVDSNMDFDSKSSLTKEYKGIQRTFKTVGITLSALVALVGIMNVMTSILSRRKELAMLQSIGMTNKQVLWILILESMMYIFLTIGVILTIGSGICYFGLASFILLEASYMKLYFTVIPTLLCLPILMIIAIVVPVMSQMNVCKSSIVERLREVE